MKSFFNKVDVETLCVFGVEIVCGPEEFNEFTIVVEKVIFGKVEIIAYTKIDENLTIVVIKLQSSFHGIKHLSCMNRILFQVEEVEQTMNSPNELAGCTTASICAVLFDAPQIPAGIQSFQWIPVEWDWNLEKLKKIHRNGTRIRRNGTGIRQNGTRIHRNEWKKNLFIYL